MTADGWQVTRFENAGAFLERSVGFLTRFEAHNCLLLGIADQLRDYPERQLLPAYMAVVTGDEEIAGAAVMTPPYGVVLAMSEAPGAIAALAADAHDFRPQTPGVIAPVPISQWFAEAWEALTGDEIAPNMSERLYQLTRVRPQPPVAGHARRANEGDRALLRVWLTDFEIEALGESPADVDQRIDTMLTVKQRGIYLWEVDGQPVSLAGYAGPTPRGIRIGPVYTPPALRGHGYASACVARLSQDMLDGGRTFCLLYTDLTNSTSNHIYQELGYEPVCDAVEYRFTRPASLA
jgi:predicted GNAT family acetyltransferase